MLTKETELLTYVEAAKLLKLPVGSLYGLVSKGVIPHIRLSKRIVRFDRSKLLALIEANQVEAIERPSRLAKGGAA